MATMMPMQDVKRRGMSALDQALAEGPVHLLKRNRPAYVVLSESDYQQMLSDLADARLAASESDLRARRVHRGSAADLMRELEA